MLTPLLSINPRETKSPGQRGWWTIPIPVWVFYDHTNYLKCGWGLKSRTNGLIAALEESIIFGHLHFVVSSGGAQRGMSCPAARPSWKIRQNRGWEALWPDLVGAFALPAAKVNFLFLHNSKCNYFVSTG